MQKTILVVDGDLSVLSVIKSMLESGDYNVLIAHSAASALAVAERDDLRIDLMLLEVLMPDITGPDLAERIRTIRPRQKALFMSANRNRGLALPRPRTQRADQAIYSRQPAGESE